MKRTGLEGGGGPVRMSAPVLMLMSALVLGLGLGSAAAAQGRDGKQSGRERLIGAWRLVKIEAPDASGGTGEPQPKGMLIYTRDGHMSVQLMYPRTELSNEYVQDGYEASFGSYEVDEAAHTVTHHVQGSVTRDQLTGKSLTRSFAFTADGLLVIRSTRPDEHWMVTWEHERGAGR